MVTQHCNKIKMYLLLFQFAMIWFLSLATNVSVEGTEDVWLEPTDLEVTAGSIATFNCTLKCEHQYTHSMQWLVGGHSFRMRRVLLSYRSIYENRFYRQTGIKVTIEEETTCGSGQLHESMKQTLSFTALSVEAMNKSAVQCVAIRKDPSLQRDFLSYYSVLLVKEPVSADVSTELSPQPSSIPTPSTVTAAACPTKTQTEYVTVSRTLYIHDVTDIGMPPAATQLPPSPTAPNKTLTDCCCCQKMEK